MQLALCGWQQCGRCTSIQRHFKIFTCTCEWLPLDFPCLLAFTCAEFFFKRAPVALSILCPCSVFRDTTTEERIYPSRFKICCSSLRRCRRLGPALPILPVRSKHFGGEVSQCSFVSKTACSLPLMISRRREMFSAWYAFLCWMMLRQLYFFKLRSGIRDQGVLDDIERFTGSVCMISMSKLH